MSSHPAISYLKDYLDSIVEKKLEAFAAGFGGREAIFANLPGGVQVTSAKKFVEMHREFFASAVSRFSYGKFGHLMETDSHFTCSVPAHVVLPNGSMRDVYIDVTLVKEGKIWIPVRFINTVIDPKQAVLQISHG